MPYQDVKAKCFFCGATIEGNQKYMLGGRNTKVGRLPRWLKEKPEHKWVWNGLGDYTLGEPIEFIFYLCPLHQTQEHYDKAFEWAQKQIDGQKALAKLVI